MRAITLAAGLALVAGCAKAPDTPAAPPYERPITFNAKKAFLEAYAADVAAIEVGEAPSGEVNAVSSVAMRARNDRMLYKRHGDLAVSAFQKLELSDCVWGPFDARKLSRETRARVGAAPAGAYACSYKAHFQINPPHGEKFQREGEGQFFERDGKLIYAGRYPNPYI
ncbi:MAG: hypothetical protein K2Q06_10475 [Parvularculaceae bacterium]|nr:hypothetical protein [Parvularculaceae bacterium]